MLRVVRDLLVSVGNLPAVPQLPPPDSPRTPMAGLYLQAATPSPGSPPAPLNVDEQRVLRQLQYLYEVETAPPLDPSIDPAVARPESHLHAHLQHEVRRELGLLHFDVPQLWREPAVCELAPLILARARELNVQLTEARVLGAQLLPPVAGVHLGGMRLWVVAWNGASPPPLAAPLANPDGWDPGNPLGNGHDPLFAPVRLTLEWIDALPAPAH